MCEDDVLAMLHEACRKSSIEDVRLALSQGVNVNACITGSAGTVLDYAVYVGDVDICRLLIEHGADVNSGTPLITAAHQGHESVCELLIAKGADPNRYAHDGCLALTQAAWRGYAKICALLISGGADTNQIDKFVGSFPLLNATYEQSDDGEGSFETCTVLLNAGANIDQADSSGLTTLMDVAKRGNIETCCLLLTRGAGIDLLNSAGETAIDLAMSARHPETAMLLSVCKQGDQKGRIRELAILDCAKLITSLPERFDDYFQKASAARLPVESRDRQAANGLTLENTETGDQSRADSAFEHGDDKDLEEFDRCIANSPHQRWDGIVRPSSTRFRHWFSDFTEAQQLARWLAVSSGQEIPLCLHQGEWRFSEKALEILDAMDEFAAHCSDDSDAHQQHW
ncbi:ankyrin repeat domain-containing protein [Rhodoferax antarcticus]|uniref:Ankyrin repeat domain protein n=1 Tax=Rhodoferax antarcticus ANT.BR TaxID=1111071 RepID=A0A1Q8YK54_9BURK|nr:ankyrin repeat domain-containing protein [Rhodoferax antarcticus]OLP08426.1 ankyrin repeat domain protein [Rhodoferax antarcticus ANT.BR]